MAKNATPDKQVEKNEPTMTFPNLRNNTHILRVTGQDGKIACELRFEKDIFGWDRDTKTCDNSRIRLEVHKPIEGSDEMRKVKEYRISTKDESKVIWMGDMILKAEGENKVESV